jgi:hypothetical protein
MEYPASGLNRHLDLGVRGADDHVAYRTMPAPSSPDPSPRDGLRQDPALNVPGVLGRRKRSTAQAEGSGVTPDVRLMLWTTISPPLSRL